MPKKLIYCSPTYGPVSDPAIDRNHRMAIMHAANQGHQWIGDASPDRLGWAEARNWAVDHALDAGDDVDGIIWVDSDILMPIHTISRLVMYDMDFVSGLYFQRLPPHYPVAAVFNEENFNWWSSYPENVLAPCDGVGFGCVYTSMKMLRKMKESQKNPDAGLFGGDFNKRTYGEDFLFCLRAAEHGFKPHVDTAIKCEHQMSSSYATEATYKAFRKQMVTGPKED